MESLILKVVVRILGGLSPVRKGIIAFFTFLGIYIKDSKMLSSIFNELMPVLTFIDLSDKYIIVASIIIPFIIIGIEIFGLFIHDKKERKVLLFFVKKIPLLMIFFVTFGKYIIVKLLIGAQIVGLLFTSFKCLCLFILIFALHELFLHALEGSKDYCWRLVKIYWHRKAKKGVIHYYERVCYISNLLYLFAVSSVYFVNHKRHFIATLIFNFIASSSIKLKKWIVLKSTVTTYKLSRLATSSVIVMGII